MSQPAQAHATQTEFVCKEQLNETIKTFVDERHDKEKPLWTRERIEEVITAIELFKLAPRKCDSDPAVKIVPTEEFYHILRKTHQSAGHGGTAKMLEIRIFNPHFGCTGVFETVHEDLDQFVKQQHNDNTSTSEDLPAAGLINNNPSTSEDVYLVY
ncbi:hypothetical protein ILUMI_20164 [Ignelater luminosus]|uniref:Uncharacterized protein n=1 Tax=Ignelater luminosus TaxID=2038154 RepID=A0A8K0CK89_IGNLU|nr:hypothetical protein ILUMI_20164 [Ignelater luminosus]